MGEGLLRAEELAVIRSIAAEADRHWMSPGSVTIAVEWLDRLLAHIAALEDRLAVMQAVVTAAREFVGHGGDIWVDGHGEPRVTENLYVDDIEELRAALAAYDAAKEGR